MKQKILLLFLFLLSTLTIFGQTVTFRDCGTWSGDPIKTVSFTQNGYDANGHPTYNIGVDDLYTYKLIYCEGNASWQILGDQTANCGNAPLWRNGSTQLSPPVVGNGNWEDLIGCNGDNTLILGVGPAVTTAVAAIITGRSATLGGNLTSTGTGTVTEKGIVYGLTANTIDNKTIVTGTTTGAFTSDIVGLTPSTDYYVRSYAISEIGTTYGVERTFKTAATFPVITAAGTLTAMTTAYGTASASQSFTVSGADMNAGVLVTPPSGFEVSLNNTAFTPTVTVGAAGNFAATNVYIRLAATAAAGNYTTSNVALTSSGATTKNVATAATNTVSQLPLTITATGPPKAYGTALTAGTSTTNFTTTGTLVTGQTVTGITLTPNAAGLSATTAAGAAYLVTPSLATGAGGFLASNYNITYTPFNGTVGQAALTIAATGPAKTYGTVLIGGTSTTNFTATGNLATGQTVTGVTLTPDAAGLSATTAAGGAYTVTPSLATGAGGFLASNYNITYAPFNGTVTQAALTIAATGPAKSYGTALTAGTSTDNFTATGALLSGESVTGVTLTPNAAGLSATTAAGATYVVTPSLATGAGGFLASNYNITYTPFNGTVTQAALTIAATGPAKTYGTALTAGASTINFTATGALLSGETVTGVTLTPNAAGLSATTAAGGAYTVTPSLATGAGGFLASNYNITYTPFNGTVAQAALTIAATGPAKIYGTVLTAGTSTTNFTATGALAGGQTVTGVTLTPDAAGLSATTAAGATYSVTPSLATGAGGFLASNYNITYTPYNGTVTQAALTIAATGPAKAYGSALTAGTSTNNFTATGALLIGETVTGVTLTPNAAGLSATTAAGDAYVVTPSFATGTGGFLASNYSIIYTPFNGIVAKAALTIAATGPAKTYGTALIAGTSATNFTATGALSSGETVTGVTLTPNAAGLSATTAAGGAYTVTPSLATGTGGFLTSNYNITYTPFNSTVAQAALTIAATGPAKTYGTVLTAGTSTTNFTATGNLATGQTVTGVTLTPDAAGLSATTAAGATYLVTPSLATGAGGFLASNYNITYTAFNGTVAQAALTIAATGPAKTYGTALTAGTSTTNFTASGSLLSGEIVTGVTLTPNAAGLSTTTSAGANYVITPSLATGAGGFSASNYNITYTPFNGTVAQATLTIAATGPAKTYGTALTAGTSTTNFTATGALLSGETVTGITLTPNAAGLSATTAAGAAYVVTPSLATGTGGFIASNYNITYSSFNGTVAQAALTIAATGPAKTYGRSLTTGTSTTDFAVTGTLANGQTVTGVTLTPNAAGLSATTAAGVTYVVTPSLATGAGGFLAANYNITYTPFTGTVTQAALTIAATGPAKNYGTALTAITNATNFTVTGTMPTGQTVTGITLTPDAAGLSANTPAGAAYVVTPSSATGTGGFLAANYNITYTPFNGLVGQTALTITATGPVKTYGAALTVVTGATDFTASGALLSGEAVTGVTLTPNAAGLSATTATGTAYVVTPSAATGIGGFLAENYAVTYVPFNGTVSPALLTVTATGPAKTYGTALVSAASTTNFTVTGTLFAGQALTSVTLTPNAAGISTTTAAGAAYTVTPSAATGTGGFLASNYSIVYTPFTGTVAQLPLTVTATGPAKIYGTALTTTTSTGNFTVTDGTPVAGQALTSVTLTPDAAGLSAATAAGAAYVVTPSAATGTGGFLESNYAINYIPFNGTVGKAALTIAATGPAKIYGTALTAGTNTTNFTAIGTLLSGQSVTGITLTPDAAGLSATTAAGTAYTITPSLATGDGGFLESNYNVTYTPFNGTVGKAALAVAATGPAKVYGTALTAGPSTTDFTATGALATGETVTSVTLTPNAAGLSAATAAGATYVVTPSAATGSGGFSAANYNISYAPFSGTVTRNTITITATGPAKVYGTALTTGTSTTNFTTAGTLAAGQAITSVTLTPDAAGLSAATAAGTRYQITPSAAIGTGGFDAANYNMVYTPFSGTVSKTPITITANTVTKTYGTVLTGGAANTNFTLSGGTLQNGNTITGVTVNYTAGNTANATVGTYAAAVTPSLATGAGAFNAANYQITYNNGDVVVNKSVLGVTADAKTKTFGAADPALTYSITSGALVGTDQISGTLTRTAGENTGVYPIVQNTLTAGSNYTLNYTGANLSITAAAQTITFAALATKLSTDVPFTLIATASSGLTVTYSSSDATVARIVNGNQVEIVKAGTVVITASQSGNANYSAATPVTQNLIILNSPPPVITIVSSRGSSLSKGQTAVLTASGAVTYQWTNSSGIIDGINTAALTVRPSVTTTYTVTGANQYGRTSTQSFTIEVLNDYKALNITNVMTPNGDGVNDRWIVENIDLYPNNTVKIVDRSGRMVYEKKGYDNSWDAMFRGYQLSEGTYYYLIDFGPGIGTRKGFITIVKQQ
ncbi:MBG domain-containing protein [Pedobacter sp. MR2016-24]|uniref:MBG domain-containing protein n=1 Tax=Pedobacter sp. MR2016-24 TaxID=2994466 RepID=UPI0022468AD9|nr:MBG domain-containing protein [Pedobacter sp. MR2016-24]MCX2484888.1 MBG domain-containing protein [Pedobacter sp. MR2016-24]